MPVAQPRPTGAIATLARTGRPQVVSATGGTLDVETGPAAPGFNPIDLLHASLAACLVLSARIAASELGLLDRLASVRAEAGGTKAADDPSRLGRLTIAMTLEGRLDDEERRAILHRAEAICTVSNTLRQPPELTLSEAGPGHPA